MAAAGASLDAPPWRLTGEARARFLEAYYAEEALRHDKPGPLLARALRRPEGSRLIVVTSRPERLRSATEAELRGLGAAPDALIMAPPGTEDDWRERMLELLAEEYGLALVLDPDPWVRRAAERLGAEAPRPRGRAHIRPRGVLGSCCTCCCACVCLYSTSTETHPMALVQVLEEALRSGDEREIERAVKELKKWLDWFGPRYFGLAVQDTWIAAPPERRQMIEEMVKELESVHKEAAWWAQYYIKRAKEAEKKAEKDERSGEMSGQEEGGRRHPEMCARG
ncbi:MAG: hypothetical protein RXN79_02745 [Candidatus Nanopusillus sp.]